MAQGIVLNQGEFKGKDETQTLQLDGTNYVVSFDVSESSLWLGNKTIDFTGTGNTDTRIEFSNDIEGQLGCTTDGDDLVINIFRTVESDGLGADLTVDKTRIIGTLRIKNGATGFFTDGDRSLFLFGDHNLWDKGSTSPIWLNNFDVGDENATEKQILKGSYLSEIFYCGKGNDEIYTGPGGGDEDVNSVYLNTGNATVTLGAADELIYIEDKFKSYSSYSHEYVDSFWVPQEAVFSKGGSTIIGATSNDVLYFADKAHDYVDFYRKGNDLVVFEYIARSYDYGNTKRYFSAYEARVNIKDYYTALSKIEIDGYTNSEGINNAIQLTEGKGTLKGTFGKLEEAFVANGKSTIYTADGYDDVYLSTGNDTVIANGSGYKTIYASGATGHATVVIKDKNAQVGIQYLGCNPANDYDVELNKSGNDLVISPGYSYNYAMAGHTTSSVTIKDFFKSEYDISLLEKDIESYLSYASLDVTGKTKKKNTLHGTKFSDKITGGKKNDTIYTGAGNDTVRVTGGNDKVIIDGAGTKTIDLINGDVTIERKNSSAVVNIINSASSSGVSQFLQKSKNDLIIRAYYLDGSKIIQRKAVIKNAFNSDGTLKEGFSLNGNDVDGIYTGFEYISGKGKITLNPSNDNIAVSGSAKNDTINTSANIGYSAVFAGNGNDKIILGGGSSIVNCEGGNDTINVNYGSGNTIYTGAGKDIVNINSGSNNTIYMGEGNDTININESSSNTLHFNDGDGNDTININADIGSPTLIFRSGTSLNNDYNLSKSGSNLVITRYYQNSKGKTKSDTVTLNKIFDKESTNVLDNTKINGNDIAGSIYNGEGLIIKGTYNKKKKATYFYGTKYKDVINGTNKKDIITLEEKGDPTVSDVITTGKGNDTIYVGHYNSADLLMKNGDGNDTLIFDNSVIDSSYTGVNIKYTGKGEQGANRKGDDLILYNVYEQKGNIKTDSLVIKDYYKAESIVSNVTKLTNDDVSYYTDYEFYSFNPKTKWEINIDSKRLITSSVKNDTITANGEAIIFSGKGKDNITVKNNATVYAGQGNDTITIDCTMSGKKINLNFNKGDGNDTIITKSGFSRLDININDLIPAKYDTTTYMNADNYINNFAKSDGTLRFKQSGDDIVFVRNGKKTETITFKGYYADTTSASITNLGYTYFNFIGNNSSSTNNNALTLISQTGGVEVEGSYNKKTKTTTYNGSSNLISYIKGNKYIYSGKGKAVMNGCEGRDNYYVTLNKNSNVIISDKGSLYNDTLVVNAKATDVSLFFDVRADGVVNNDAFSNLMIFQKGSMTSANILDTVNHKYSMTGKININSFFGSDSNADTIIDMGSGQIETIQIGGNNTNITEWITDVAFDVAQWLTQNSDKGYNYASSVINSGNQNDINALLAIYKGSSAADYSHSVYY